MSVLLQRESKYSHEIRRAEQENAKLKERLLKVINSSLVWFKFLTLLEVLNYLMIFFYLFMIKYYPYAIQGLNRNIFFNIR